MPKFRITLFGGGKERPSPPASHLPELPSVVLDEAGNRRKAVINILSTGKESDPEKIASDVQKTFPTMDQAGVNSIVSEILLAREEARGNKAS